MAARRSTASLARALPFGRAGRASGGTPLGQGAADASREPRPLRKPPRLAQDDAQEDRAVQVRDHRSDRSAARAESESTGRATGRGDGPTGAAEGVAARSGSSGSRAVMVATGVPRSSTVSGVAAPDRAEVRREAGLELCDADLLHDQMIDQS